jgi:hypothetical protein
MKEQLQFENMRERREIEKINNDSREHIIQLNQGEKILKKIKMEVEELTHSMNNMKRASEFEKQKVLNERRRKLKEIKELFPLRKHPKYPKKIFFCKKILPEDINFLEWDSPSGTVLLENIAIISTTLSIILEVVLPYEAIRVDTVLAMRSRIPPDEEETTWKSYKLTKEGNDIHEFKIALDFLCTNVYFLCTSQGIIFEDCSNTKPFILQNLHVLYKLSSEIGSSRKEFFVSSYSSPDNEDTDFGKFVLIRQQSVI